MQINGDRLLDDLKRLRQFGASGNGVMRPSFSDIDMESRRWLMDRLTAAGLDPVIDGVGNVIGRSCNPGPALLIGSHTDTQPQGGWLDGALGVMYGLEVARTFAENPETSHLAVDVASWMDEEGTFTSCLGSQVFCGDITVDDFDNICSGDGVSIADAVRRLGLRDKPVARLEPDRHRAYLEAHIEQGPWLETSGKRIGVVTGIVGLVDIAFRFDGQQNHAGSTPMHLRQDAAAAMVDLAARINRDFPGLASDSSVWTIGEMELDTKAVSIIPGGADMMLQFRDQNEAVLERLREHVDQLVAEANEKGPVKISHRLVDQLSPAPMDQEFQAHFKAAAEAHAEGYWQVMPSGAVHDALVLAEHIPAAMLFIPSIGGVSHSFAEDTDEADIVLGCQVFADGARRIQEAMA